MKRAVLVALGWAWAAAIVWLSLTPQPPTIDIEQGDKLGHFVSYGVLMFWFSLLYRRAFVQALYGAGFVAMGVAIEFLQGMTGYRTYDELDMLANGIGVLLGFGAAALALRTETMRRLL